MTAPKTVAVAKTWTLNYTDVEGNQKSAILRGNADYRFSWKYIDSDEINETVATVARIGRVEGSTDVFLFLDQVITPGFANVIKPASESDGSIPIWQITGVEEVKAVFDSARRTNKQSTELSDSTFRFQFTSWKTGNPYNVIIAKGEFVAISFHGKKNDQKRYFGHIVDIDDEGNVIFDRYVTYMGRRSYRGELKIPSSDVINVSRYECNIISIDEFNQRLAERKNARGANKETESTDSAESTDDSSSVNSVPIYSVETDSVDE